LNDVSRKTQLLKLTLCVILTAGIQDIWLKIKQCSPSLKKRKMTLLLVVTKTKARFLGNWYSWFSED